MSFQKFSNSFFHNLFKPTYLKRFFFFVFSDVVIFLLSYILSFSIRFSINELVSQYETFNLFLPIFIFSKIIMLLLFDIYAISWKYFSMNDALKMFCAILFAQIIAYISAYIFFRNHFIIILSRSVFFLDFFISLFFLVSLRSFKRIMILMMNKKSESKEKIIIYGAGDGGEQMLREMLKKESTYDPVAILDDNKNKWSMRIHGIPILGGLQEIKKVMKKSGAKAVLIAIPSINKEKLKEIFKYLEKEEIKDIKILPSVQELLSRKLTLNNVKNIDITDLLGRESINLDKAQIGAYLRNQVILVTGACGSIGSEIFKQVLEYEPQKILALDINETELFYLDNKTPNELKSKVEMVLADVREKERVDEIFRDNNIDIVFHAAALKHVSMCEKFPLEAIKTNIQGTYNLVNASMNKVKRFLFISTDKAVNPSSIMGGTKRIAEFIVTSSGIGKTIFSSVRFGNVLGSRGSVLPIFEEQIKSKKPVTITHPDMKRYFMTTKEAVQLCLETAGGAKGGEVFILDMGEPILIREIAENMIKMYGYKPYKEIKIIFTGKRKGEKIFEELFRAEERVKNTRFEKIFRVIGSNRIEYSLIQGIVNEFLRIENHEKAKDLLQKYISGFKYEE